MTVTDADVEVVRRAYAAFGAGDLAAMESCFAPGAIWHFPGRSLLAGDHKGWPAIRDEFVARLRPLSGGTVRVRLLDIAVGADYVVAVQHATADYEGRRFDVTGCQLMRAEGGRIVEVWGHYSDQYAFDAFWQPARAA